MSDKRIESFDEFWPFYLAQHSRPACRALHYVGALGVALALGWTVATGNPLWLLAAPVLGYGPAWLGHVCIERNRPATFGHIGWSIRGEFKMCWLFVTGRLADEITRQAAQPQPVPVTRRPTA